MKNQYRKLHSSAPAEARLITAPKLLALLALLGTTGAQAANDQWITAPTDANFSTAANWLSGTSPVTGDSWEFTNSTLTALNNDISGLSVSGIVFDAGASAFTITNSAITLTGGITNNGTAAQTISVAITNTGTNTITTTAGGGNITLGGIISGASTGLIKTGAGTLTLSGANTYTGNTTLSGGTTLLGNGTGFGSGGTIILNGATLAGSGAQGIGNTVSVTALTTNTIGVTGGGALTLNRFVTLTGSGELDITGTTFTFSQSNDGSTTTGYTGNLVLTTTLQLGTASGKNGTINLQNAAVTLGSGGSIGWSTSGSGGLTSTFNLGSLSSTNGNGQIGFSSGSNKSDAFSIGNLNTSTIYSGTIVNGNGNVANTLTKVGTGTLSLSGTNTYTGTTTISAGTLALATTGKLASTNINVGTLASQGTFDISAANGYTLLTNQTIGAYGLVNAGTGTLTVNGAITDGATRAITSVTGGLTLGTNATTTLTIATNGAAGVKFDQLAVSGVLLYNGTLNLNINYTPTNGDTFQLFSASTYTAGLTNVILAGSWNTGSFTSAGAGIWNWTSTNSSIVETLNESTGVLSAVPEPSTWVLFSLSGLVLVVASRRRCRRTS